MHYAIASWAVKKGVYYYETSYTIHDPGLRAEFIKIIGLFFRQQTEKSDPQVPAT